MKKVILIVLALICFSCSKGKLENGKVQVLEKYKECNMYLMNAGETLVPIWDCNAIIQYSFLVKQDRSERWVVVSEDLYNKIKVGEFADYVDGEIVPRKEKIF